jgi:hypothetical protein
MKLESAKWVPVVYEPSIFTRMLRRIDDAVNSLLSGSSIVQTKTSSFSVQKGCNWYVCNGGASITVTLPGAANYDGSPIHIKTIAAFTVVSASSNVVPLAGGAAGTAILAATAGKFATLVSNGTDWVVMEGN